ncbi:hypothetical protein [Novosphingobium terrae]|uniref:hypothetical protein n=1 Tax=Novosphingobium terrae TaxID=2726189 RepID=UPI001F13AAE2|nr:hypothetical protein [Novosphingobium terrae]
MRLSCVVGRPKVVRLGAGYLRASICDDVGTRTLHTYIAVMLRSVPAKTRSVVLVCSKCSKKLGGGFGKKGSKPLVKELRKLTGAGKGRKADLLVLESPCLKLCPKGAVAVMDATTPETWLIVPAQSDVKEVAEKLGMPVMVQG